MSVTAFAAPPTASHVSVADWLVSQPLHFPTITIHNPQSTSRLLFPVSRCSLVMYRIGNLCLAAALHGTTAKSLYEW